MDHAAYFLEQIIDHAPRGADESIRDPESGCDHVWFCVRVPVLRGIVKSWRSEHGTRLTFGDWQSTLDNLYAGKSIDERQIAGYLLAAFPEFRKQLSLARLDVWLGQLVGWKEVDTTCQSTFTASELLSNWETWTAFLLRLSQDRNINKRRASLVLLVKPMRSAPPEILSFGLSLVDALKDEKSPLITKAISWLLRTAASSQPRAIAEYLEEQQQSLPAIAVRETKRKLATGKK